MIANQNSHFTYLDIASTKNGDEILLTKLKSLQPTWTNWKAKKITIAVDKDCLIKVNGEDELLVKPEYGLSIEYSDKDIETIATLTSGCKLYAIIGY